MFKLSAKDIEGRTSALSLRQDATLAVPSRSHSISRASEVAAAGADQPEVARLHDIAASLMQRTQ
jgi:hypothetical protein